MLKGLETDTKPKPNELSLLRTFGPQVPLTSQRIGVVHRGWPVGGLPTVCQAVAGSGVGLLPCSIISAPTCLDWPLQPPRHQNTVHYGIEHN